MKVTVRMFGRYRQQFWDRKEESLPDGSTIEAALKEVMNGSPGGTSALFDEKGEVRPHLILMVNRKRIARSDYRSAVLHDGDELAVMPPVAGG